ncbi:MAG: FkbM family methyltransferase [Pyrinomonadaceae bacterium]
MSSLLPTSKVPDLVYDIGLHHGQDTDFFLKKGFRVVAFEADPTNAEFCRERFADAISAGRLTVVEGAITEDFSGNGSAGKVKFYKNADHSLWGSTSDDWAVRNEVLGTRNDIISVTAINFAQCLQKYGVPNYLKADIVGSETICLRALLKFENKPDYLSIRSEKLVFKKLEYEFDLLEQLGYRRFKVVDQHFEDLRPLLPSGNGSNHHHIFEEGASGPFGEETRGRWCVRESAIAKYRRIFVKYWLFGDYSYLIQTSRGRHFINRMEGLFKRSIPGWYDTHARHASI